MPLPATMTFGQRDVLSAFDSSTVSAEVAHEQHRAPVGFESDHRRAENVAGAEEPTMYAGQRLEGPIDQERLAPDVEQVAGRGHSSGRAEKGELQRHRQRGPAPLDIELVRISAD